MKLIGGLGNPGEKYAKTRHNVGWLVLEELKQEISKQIPNPNFKFQKKLQSELLKLGDLLLAKPQTMVNESGKAVRKLITHYKVKFPNLWTIHDDLDLRLGTYKIQKGKGPREHKGLLSIYEALGTRDFWHVRIGIENRSRQIRNPKSEIRNNSQISNDQNSKKRYISGQDYVLQEFTREEKKVIDKVIGEKVVPELIKRLY